MARILVTLDGRTESGGTPLLMHCDRMADPLHPFPLELSKFTSKRKKTESDHLEIALLEFMGCMYNDATDKWLAERPGAPDPLFTTIEGEEVLVPYIPGWQVFRSIQEAAKRHKHGKLVSEALSVITKKAPVKYDGPTDVSELWQDGRFALRKSVGIGQSRTMRTRPMFEDWQLEVEMELELALLDVDRLNQFAEEAGMWKSIGDYRQLYGRYKGAATLAAPKSETTKKQKAVA